VCVLTVAVEGQALGWQEVAVADRLHIARGAPAALVQGLQGAQGEYREELREQQGELGRTCSRAEV